VARLRDLIARDRDISKVEQAIGLLALISRGPEKKFSVVREKSHELRRRTDEKRARLFVPTDVVIVSGVALSILTKTLARPVAKNPSGGTKTASVLCSIQRKTSSASSGSPASIASTWSESLVGDLLSM